MIPSAGMVERPRCSTLADVIDTILDKGLVIDAFVRVSLVGIELLTIDARIVVASVDTYLRFAEAVGRLDLHENRPKDLPGLVEGLTQGGAKGKTTGVIESAGEKVRDFFDNDEDDDEDDRQPARRRRSRNGHG